MKTVPFVSLVTLLAVAFAFVPVLPVSASPAPLAVNCDFWGAITRSDCSAPGHHSTSFVLGSTSQGAWSEDTSIGESSSAYAEIYCSPWQGIEILAAAGTGSSGGPGADVHIIAGGYQVVWARMYRNSAGAITQAETTYPEYNVYCDSFGDTY